ncbi:MAG: hypothetical protein HFJ12_01555 [Bacilli bacterium]|nr:hypothetical protein [Bacilli bacterium]
MNRKKVESLLTSVEDESVKKGIVDGFLDLHGDIVAKKDTEIATLKNDITVKQSLIEDLNTKIKEADKVDIEAIKKEQYDLGKADGSKEVETFKQNNALEKALSSYKAKDNDVLSKMIDNSKLEFEVNSDGTYEIKGLEEQIQDLKENKSFLFGDKEEKTIDLGADHSTQAPTNDFDFNFTPIHPKEK